MWLSQARAGQNAVPPRIAPLPREVEEATSPKGNRYCNIDPRQAQSNNVLVVDDDILLLPAFTGAAFSQRDAILGDTCNLGARCTVRNPSMRVTSIVIRCRLHLDWCDVRTTMDARDRRLPRASDTMKNSAFEQRRAFYVSFCPREQSKCYW